MEPHCRGRRSDPGRGGLDNPRFVEAVLWIARTGSPWRDPPPLFGPWNTVFKRYRDWVRADVFKRLFDAASDQPDMEAGHGGRTWRPDMEYAMVDATILKSLPRRRPRSIATERRERGEAARQAIGRSRGGMTTRTPALTDAPGNPVRFVPRPGQRFDTAGVAPLIDGLEFGALITDKALDGNDIIADRNRRGGKIVLSQHPRRAIPLRIDTEMCKGRHLIENFFCRLKEFKRIAPRADKTDQSLGAMLHPAPAILNSRRTSTEPKARSGQMGSSDP
jgi:transposase